MRLFDEGFPPIYTQTGTMTIALCSSARGQEGSDQSSWNQDSMCPSYHLFVVILHR